MEKHHLNTNFENTTNVLSIVWFNGHAMFFLMIPTNHQQTIPCLFWFSDPNDDTFNLGWDDEEDELDFGFDDDDEDDLEDDFEEDEDDDLFDEPEEIDDDIDEDIDDDIDDDDFDDDDEDDFDDIDDFYEDDEDEF